MKKTSPWPGILLGVAVVGSAIFAIKTMGKKDKPSPDNELPSDRNVNEDLGIGASTGGGWISDKVYPIRQGSKGSIVEALQKLLVAAGQDISVDGYWGPQTNQAFTAFFGKDQVKSDSDLINTVLSKVYQLPNVKPVNYPLLNEARVTIERHVGKKAVG